MDFSNILAALDGPLVVSALASLALLMVAPRVASWAYNMIIAFIPDDSLYDPDDQYENRQ